MINSSLEIPDSEKQRLSSIIAFEGTNFSKLVAIAGLSKSTDFVGVDLSKVDFSNSDIRGFNFTDADLSGTYGINVQMDQTTIFDGANVRNSVFALEKERRDYFSANHDHYELYQRLKKEYWTTGAIWIGENLRRTSKNFEASSQIAKYLYASVTDQTYKNQILYGIKHTFKTKEDYKDFLLDQLKDPTITKRSLRGIIDILSRVFYADPSVQTIILLFLGNADKEIRKLCVRPVMAGRFFERNREAIIDHMKREEDSQVRRLFTMHFSSSAKVPDPDILYNEDRKSFHDYADPIDERTFEVFVRGSARRQKITRKIAQIQRGYSSAGTAVSLEDFERMVYDTNAQLAHMKHLGLPLIQGYSFEKVRKHIVRYWAGAD